MPPNDKPKVKQIRSATVLDSDVGYHISDTDLQAKLIQTCWSLQKTIKHESTYKVIQPVCLGSDNHPDYSRLQGQRTIGQLSNGGARRT